MPPTKILQIFVFVLTVVNGVLYSGTVIQLLLPHVGSLAYVLWILVAPFLSPAVIALPWFDAWVNDSSVSYEVLVLWLLWISAFCGLALRSIAAQRARKSEHHEASDR